MRFFASLLMIGPMTVLRSEPSPTFISSAAFFSAANNGSAASPTATTTLVATQRSPAHPNDDDIIVLAECLISASGITTEWFLAPPRACARLPFAHAVV